MKSGKNDQPKPDGMLEARDGANDGPGEPTVHRAPPGPATDQAVPNDQAPRHRSGIERIPLIGPGWSLYRSYSRRNGPLLSAGIAYYGLFSLAPLLLLTIEVTGFFVGESTAREDLKEILESFLGPYLADLFSGVLVQLQTRGSSTAAVIGVVLLLYGATKLFLRLQASFNIMWDVQLKSTRFSFRRVLSRFLAFVLILAPTVILVVSLVLNAGISWLQSLTGGSGPLLGLAQQIIPFLLAWAALTLIFTVLPDVRISWRDCWLGALATAILCALGTWLFGTYLSWSSSQKYAGSVGALIALIIWVDFMAIITLLGVRLNRLLYTRKGKPVEAYPYATIASLAVEDEDQQRALPSPIRSSDDTSPVSGRPASPPDED